MLFVLLGLSLLIFFVARVMPGDPARAVLGPIATKAQVEQLRIEMKLDRPFFVQYFTWLGGLLHGDLGKSQYTRQPIMRDLKQRLPATLELVFFATLISLIIGQTTGALAGYFRNSWFDGLSRLGAYVGIATPPFVVAVFLLLVFSLVLRLAPAVGRLPLGMDLPKHVTGFILIDSLLAGQPQIALQALKHIILPAFSLAVAHIAQEGRITRVSVIENLQKDYVAAHQMHGIPTSTIIFKFLIRPSLIPTVSIMGLDFAFTMGNAFLVEVVFMWPGFSNYAVTAMLNKDLNAVVACVLIIGLIFALVNLLVDIILPFLDPRIRVLRRSRG